MDEQSKKDQIEEFVKQLIEKQRIANKEVDNLIQGIGAIAEMTHLFYISMRSAGASEDEANAAMTSFIFCSFNSANLKPENNDDDD